MFPSPAGAYRNVGYALLASHLTSGADGFYHEQTELWSERGELLVSAQLHRSASM